MSYVNADEYLPQELINELQKYVQGALVYVPKADKQRIPWGQNSGIRHELEIRNAEIRAKKAQGQTIERLADEYALSVDGIRKVLYRKVAQAKTS